MCFALTSPTSVDAGDSAGDNTNTMAGVEGNQIMAGVQFGSSPQGSDVNGDC